MKVDLRFWRRRPSKRWWKLSPLHCVASQKVVAAVRTSNPTKSLLILSSSLSSSSYHSLYSAYCDLFWILQNRTHSSFNVTSPTSYPFWLFFQDLFAHLWEIVLSKLSLALSFLYFSIYYFVELLLSHNFLNSFTVWKACRRFLFIKRSSTDINSLSSFLIIPDSYIQWYSIQWRLCIQYALLRVWNDYRRDFDW